MADENDRKRSRSHSPEASKPSSSAHRRDRDRERSKDRSRSHRHHHHHHHHKSSSHRERSKERSHAHSHSHRHKKRRHGSDDDNEANNDGHRRQKPLKFKEPKSKASAPAPAPAPAPASGENDGGRDSEGEWVEAATPAVPLNANTAGAEIPSAVAHPETVAAPTQKRDAWMLEPDADFIDYTQKGVRKAAPEPVAKPDYRPIIHKNELNEQLLAGKSLDEYADDTNVREEGDVGYTFGDQGSNWRMRKLNRVYEAAKEEGRPVDEIALERYGDLKLFDDAREEEMELGRRETYGKDRRDAKDKPTGELYRERVKAMKAREDARREKEQGRIMETQPKPLTTTVLDQTALNRMQAALMKAQLRNDPKAAQMEKEYNAALEASLQANKNQPDVVVLSAMDSRMLAGMESRMGREVVAGKKGKVVENEDMSIEDMVREEKRTKGEGAGRTLADRITRDAKFDDNLDYLDENAAKLAQRVQKNELSLKNMAISEFKKMQQALDKCPLCQHETSAPIAPVVSLATRVFLTLATEPELAPGSCVIVPIQHRTNMLECDDDEWEEVRNFMKSLTRLYDAQDLDVLFYENASSPSRRRHAAINVVPLPRELGATAAAYFKEAILASDEQWSQHKPIIDTLAKARKDGLGKLAFRRSLVKEMPYFHVWFEIDGGMGHVIEDENRWPKGDLFAREVIGGMLDLGPEVVKRQGRWTRGGDKERVQRFRKRWEQFDWTKVLYDQ